MARLTRKQRNEIAKKYASGVQQKQLAQEFGICINACHKILKAKGLAVTHDYKLGSKTKVISIRLDEETYNRLYSYASPTKVAVEAIKWYFKAIDQQIAENTNN